ncbi:MAG TPA: phosphatidylglycerophosphatase A [Polyangiaceae bacterium]
MSPARVVSTWFGCGLAPKAPGTVGTLGTLPFAYALHALGPVAYWTGTALVTVAGTWAAQKSAEELGEEDPQSVVVDEVSGTLIALGLAAPGGMWACLFAIVLFRVLDIKKPGLIDAVQYLKPNGVGIMADDVLAGLVAGLVARLVSP